MPKGISNSVNNWTVGEMMIIKNNPSLSAVQLSIMLPGRSVKAVRNFRSKHNLLCDASIVQNLWSKEDLEFLKENASNMNMPKLMARFPNRTDQAIKDAYSKLGIDRTSFAGFDAQEIVIPQESVDLAYFMGVLASDGWTEKGCVRLDVRDKEFAEYWGKLGQQLFGIGCVFYTPRERQENHSLLYRAGLSSKKLSEWLGDFKKENWSYNDKIQFVKSSKEYAAAFLSGYIDSDGHIGVTMFIASAVNDSKKFLSDLLIKFGDNFIIDNTRIRINQSLRQELKKYLILHVKRKREAL